MRVLLVNPRFPLTFWNFRYTLELVGKKCAYPPLGLLTIAPLLPKDWELRLVDEEVRMVTKARY